MKSVPGCRKLLLDLTLVFFAAALLILPLFQARYLERWGSIESTFIADGRFLHEHWPHPQWQPLWYCGTRFDYIYPPVVRYGVALLAGVFVPVQAYHILVAVLCCWGVAGAYFLARVLSGSRAAAWLAAAGLALISPVFLVIPVTGWSSDHTPWRMWILLQYGEGPHVAALALVPFALGFAWRALEKHRPAALAAAAVFSTLVALTNFYGATALAMFYLALVWAAWVTWRDRRVWGRAAAIPALAYGLAAFWLTPSYLRLTMRNLHLVSATGKSWPMPALAGLVVLLMLASLRIRGYALFLTGSLFFFGFNVLGYVYFQRNITGDPWRLISELDFVLILAAVEVLRRLWTWRRARPLVILVMLASLWSARHYVRHAWGNYLYPPAREVSQRVEYRMSEWMASHFPQARAFVTGSNRLWWDAWHDLPQMEGGSDQGQLNAHLPDAGWNLASESRPDTAVQWLTALGVDTVIVPFEKSQEVFHDFHFPHKFEGLLPVLYDDGQGNVIYRMPRRYPSLARVVDRNSLLELPPLPLGTTSPGALQAYNSLVEHGPDAAAITAWDGTDSFRIHARIQEGQSLLAQVSYDPSWHAYLSAHELRIQPDPLAFMLINAPPGEDDIRFVFETPVENRVGWSITGLSLIIMIVLAVYGRQEISRW